MQEMIAYVAAAVIGAMILIMLGLIQWRGQHTSIDAAQFTAAKSSMLSLVEVLEEDLNNLGAGLSVPDMLDGASGATNNAGGFSGSSYAFDTTSATRRIEFYSWADTTASVTAPLATASYLVRYEWAATGQTALVLNPATNTYLTRPTYLLRRFVDGTAAGESMDSVTRIHFNLFRADGSATSTLSEVRTLDLTVRAVSPLGGGSAGMIDAEAGLAPTVSETRWQKTFRPPNLGRKAS